VPISALLQHRPARNNGRRPAASNLLIRRIFWPRVCIGTDLAAQLTAPHVIATAVMTLRHAYVTGYCPIPSCPVRVAFIIRFIGCASKTGQYPEKAAHCCLQYVSFVDALLLIVHDRMIRAIMFRTLDHPLVKPFARREGDLHFVATGPPNDQIPPRSERGVKNGDSSASSLRDRLPYWPLLPFRRGFERIMRCGRADIPICLDHVWAHLQYERTFPLESARYIRSRDCQFRQPMRDRDAVRGAPTRAGTHTSVATRKN